MMISTRQIDQTQLAAFVLASITGGPLSGMLGQYFAASGYAGPVVLYTSGGSQTVLTLVDFATNPTVPYSGSAALSAASQSFAQDKVTYYVGALSGTLTGGYVPVYGNTTIRDAKTFTGAVGVGTPILPTHAANLAYVQLVSGVLQTGLNNVTISNGVTTNGTQTISGQKTFTVSPLVVTPTSPSGAVNKAYVDALNVTGVVALTGNQTISGIKKFQQSPLVPLATLPQQAVSLQQLNALGVSIGIGTGTYNNAGVMSINGSTGAASGAVYLQGAGTVTISQCGAIFYVSGITANLTQTYTAQVPIPSGITGLAYTFPTGSGSAFVGTPTMTDSLVFTGSPDGAAAAFFGHVIYGVSTTGFNVAFETAIPSDGYAYNFVANPQTGASGFYGLVGGDGRAGGSLNSRGVWQVGLTYSNLDWVFQPSVAASYACTQTHISTVDNTPGGTGGLNWAILSSGTQGPTGYWTYRGTYNTGTVYFPANSTFLSGSSYGYTGAFPISGVSPAYLTSGWGYVAQAGAIGYFVNSGVITGNFVNLSFFLDPVDSGLHLAEAFVGQTFTMTGFALGCVTSGAGPTSAGAGKLTGSLYVRTLANTKIALQSFTFDSGVYSYVSGGLAVTVTGMGRLGLDVTNTLSGIQKFSVGMFGFGF